MSNLRNNNLIVVKHNDLINAGYRLNIYESRILLTCVSKLDSMGSISASDVFTVSCEDMHGISKGGSAYDSLKRGTKGLYKRSITIKISDDDELETRWVSSARYRRGLGVVELKFAHDVIPYISELKRDFTKYKLNNVLMFKSNYSIRIYEMLMKWTGNNQTIEVSWIKEKFELQDKYKNIGDLKKWVIDIAIREINDFSDITASYTQIKRGRTVTGFKFEWYPKKTTKVKTHQPKKTMTPAQYERLNQQRCIGKSEAEVRAMIREDASNTERAIKHGGKSATHTQGMKDINSVLAGVIPHKKG